jgi:D-aminoacyl-tRNA deacylase
LEEKMKLIIASREDPAAMNIANHLEKIGGLNSRDLRLMIIESKATEIQTMPTQADEIIVASRHESESKEPCLTVHVPGNLEDKDLAIASPVTVKSLLISLTKIRDELGLQYKVSLEATHHGPTKLPVPVTFIEIGSAPEQWKDDKAGEAIARAILESTPVSEIPQAVGFGGPHYAPHHTETVLGTNIAVGHIIPKYATIDRYLVEKSAERTKGKVDFLALDWKGLNPLQRGKLKEVSEEVGIPLLREDKLKS